MVESKWKLVGIIGVCVLLLVATFGLFALNSQKSALSSDLEKALEDSRSLQSEVSELSTDVSALESSVDSLNLELSERDQLLQATQDELERVRAEAEAQAEAEFEPEQDNKEMEVIDGLFLGDDVSFTLDDGDLEKLFDGEIRFDDEDYDVHEEFSALSGKAHIFYSATDDEELGALPALGFDAKGALVYRYVFDDPIPMADISDDEPLEIVFLGQDFEIVSADGAELDFRFGDSYLLPEGGSVDYEGRTVSLEFVGDNDRVSVCVDSVCDIIDEYDTEEIDGLDVRVEDILINDRAAMATLVLGEDTIISQKDGDEFLDEDDSPFEFFIESTGGDLEALVVSYDEKRDKVDDDFPPLFEGDELVFPFDFLTVKVYDVLEDDYVKFTFDFEDFQEELEDGTDIDKEECGVIYTDGDYIEVLDEDVDEVYVCKDGTAYYQDTSGDWFEALVTDVSLVNDDTEYALAIGGAQRLRFENADDALIRISTDWDDERLGLEEDDAEANDILLAANGIGGVEYDVLTPYGAIISAPEDMADRDQFELFIPTGPVEVELAVA